MTGVRAALDLVVVGEVMLDVTLLGFAPGEVRHAPVRVRAGGTAVNAALAAAGTGARVAVVGRVGADAAGEAIRASLRAAGVEPLLARDDSGPTGTFVEALGDGPPTIVSDRGVTDALEVGDLPAVAARGTLVSGYLLFRERTQAVARAALHAFGSEVVGVTAGAAALVERLGLAEVRRLAGGAGVVFANGEEACALTGVGGDAAALALADAFGTACVTSGADGAVAVAGGRLERAAPGAIAAGSALGAGDALAGAMVAALAGGSDLAGALRAGVEAGARAAAETVR